MDTVKIDKTNSGLYLVECPYNKEFVKRIKELGGKWTQFEDGSRKWVVSPEALELVKQCLREIYGTDGTYTARNVKLRLHVDTRVRGDYEEFGRTLIRVMGRDSGVLPADGVIIVSGEATSGGSMKHPATILENCVLEFCLPETYVDREDVKKAIEEGRMKIIEGKRTREEIIEEIRKHEEAIALLKKELEEE